MAKKLIGHDADQVPVNGFLGSLAYIDTETDPTVGAHIKAITTTDISNWDAAFGWGDHSLAGYALSSSLGTMSTQDATSVAITGGSINGTTVGATTASTGRFSTATILNTLSLSQDYTETISSSTGNTTINLANGTIFLVTTNGTNTITLPSASAGKSFIVGIGYGGAHAVSWAGGSTINWPGGTAPTLTSTSGRIDFFSFFQTATETYGIPVAFDVY